MDDYHDRLRQRSNDYYRWQRETSARRDSEDRRRRRGDDMQRDWQENGYPGFWEIVAGLIIFAIAVAVLAGR